VDSLAEVQSGSLGRLHKAEQYTANSAWVARDKSKSVTPSVTFQWRDFAFATLPERPGAQGGMLRQWANRH